MSDDGTSKAAGVGGGGAPPRAEVIPRRPRPGLSQFVDPGALARRPSPNLVKAAPNVARVAAVSAWHVVSWSLTATVAGANYVAQRAVEGEAATTIMQDAANDLRNVAWRALGLRDDVAPTRSPAERNSPKPSTPQDLQRRGTDLLRRSNDVHVVEDTHPAFARILTEITPDEARMLRFLYLEGPQPAVDVRTFRPFGIGSVLVAEGLNMIAEHAGCRNVQRSNPYLVNLSRLGLLVFSREQVTNPQRYQVIEAQPKVAEALKLAGRMPRTVHRSIALTSFGTEFVRTCLPLNTTKAPPQSALAGRTRGAGDNSNISVDGAKKDHHKKDDARKDDAGKGDGKSGARKSSARKSSAEKDAKRSRSSKRSKRSASSAR